MNVQYFVVTYGELGLSSWQSRTPDKLQSPLLILQGIKEFAFLLSVLRL